MQQNKQGFMDRVAGFVAGKGFYMVLALCAAAIGVSGYVLFFTGDEAVEDAPLQISSVAPQVPKQPEITPPVVTPPAEEQPKATETTPKAQEKPASGQAQVPVAAAPVAQHYISPVTSGKVLRSHSGQELIKDETMGDWRVHNGVDISCEDGGKVCAIGDGKVTKIFFDDLTGYCITIDHGNGVISTVRGLMKNATVKEGDAVKMGAVIGGGGSTMTTESSMEPHVHLEVTKDGKSIDPESLFTKK